MRGQIELVSGLLTGTVGILGMGALIAFEGPTDLVLLSIAIALGLFAAGVALGAMWHVVQGLPLGRRLVWGAAILLWIATVIAGPYRGLLLPAALFAAIAVAATGWEGRLGSTEVE